VVVTQLLDEVVRKDLSLRADNRVNDDLVWFLMTEGFSKPRDSSLPDYLARKAKAWCRQHHEEWSEKERHLQMARAIPAAMSGGKMDERMRAWLLTNKKDRVQIELFNLGANGVAVPKRPFESRLAKALGLRRYADRVWRSACVRVLPLAK